MRIRSVHFAPLRSIFVYGTGFWIHCGYGEVRHVLSRGHPVRHSNAGLRQIHVHLAPETTSFLRMLAPAAFGDALRRSRQLVEDVQRDGQRRSGFEIGPAYAGLRGVVPVWTSGSDSGGLIGSLEVGVSVGMTLLDGADRGPDAALQRADRALYQAKSAGRNRVGIALPK